MEPIVTQTVIKKPIAEVFDFVTTPGHWPRWHPSSLGVTGVVDHSLEVDEQVTELFKVAGQEGRTVWTVRDRKPPGRWVIESAEDQGNVAAITYTLTEGPDGTTFRRELAFPKLDPARDWSRLRPVIEAESSEALQRLTLLLESSGGDSPADTGG